MCAMSAQYLYRILWETPQAGVYTGSGDSMSLRAAQDTVRQQHGGRLRWRVEGRDVCAYASIEDMDDEDKAVARLRPIEEVSQ
jgi:hypothetical protein